MSWKVCVYAICKNESAFVERWVASMKEADWVVALDTGSTDGTLEKLRALGVHVEQEEITPWRFDVARNRSMELVPPEADILVCTDLDEVIEPGWRAILDTCWTSGAKQASYRYTWSFNPDGSEGTVFLSEKIHANGGFRWVHPVHEVLEYTGDAPHEKVFCPGLQINHHADPSKSRALYLPLLELAVKERPEDDRNMHYLGREYMFRGRWHDCIETLQRHLLLPKAVWKEERCASMRFIARAYQALAQPEKALGWYFKAIAEAPYTREPYVEAAKLLYTQAEWHGVLFLAGKALSIVKRTESYITEAEAWGSLPYDLASIAAYHIGDMGLAAEMGRNANALSPNDERILGNLELFERALNNLSGQSPTE